MDTPNTPPPFTKVRRRPDGKWEPADDATATHYIAPPPPPAFRILVTDDPEADNQAMRRLLSAIDNGDPVYIPGPGYVPAAIEPINIKVIGG